LTRSKTWLTPRQKEWWERWR